jgi:hypothetical protein
MSKLKRNAVAVNIGSDEMVTIDRLVVVRICSESQVRLVRSQNHVAREFTGKPATAAPLQIDARATRRLLIGILRTVRKTVADMGGAGHIFTGEHDADVTNRTAQSRRPIRPHRIANTRSGPDPTRRVFQFPSVRKPFGVAGLLDDSR